MADPAITFTVAGDELHMHYQPRDGDEWVYRRFEQGEDLRVKRTFRLTKQLLVDPPVAALQVDREGAEELENGYDKPILTFVVARAVDSEYFEFDDRVLEIGIPVLLDRNAQPTWKWFTAEERISVMRVIASLRPSRITIGGGSPDAIPIDVYEGLIAQFPTKIERAKYVRARISGVVRQYTDAEVDAVADLGTYVDRRTSHEPRDLRRLLREAEIHKFELLLEHLARMLEAPVGTYNERAWQNEILQIIRLLYPKYVATFPSVSVKDFESSTARQLDFMLVDVSGYVDVLEIKQPFDDCIITSSVYRSNHVPYRELSGTVQQLEKYLYHLTRWGRDGEVALTKRFASSLPTGLKVRITSPSGLAILGRDHNLTLAQRHDFEIIRRQYKHIADIITYDDLLRRLRFVLEQLRAGR